MILPVTYFPKHEENRMKSEGNVELARKRFLEEKPNNLKFLLSERFSWMNSFLKDMKSVIELGSGAGFSKSFIENKNFKTSDVVKREWVDLQIDALNLPFEDNSVDALVCSHMIHHIATPTIFFKEAHRVLKTGGLVVISDIHTSLIMRVLLRLMRHEGWSYNVDVFDPKAITNDPVDPWSANCAIPELLFKNNQKFEVSFPGFKILHKEYCEFLIFPLSGGVIAKTKTIIMPVWVLEGINKFDKLLTKLFPSVFALGMRVVIQKQ